MKEITNYVAKIIDRIFVFIYCFAVFFLTSDMLDTTENVYDTNTMCLTSHYNLVGGILGILLMIYPIVLIIFYKKLKKYKTLIWILNLILFIVFIRIYIYIYRTVSC